MSQDKPGFAGLPDRKTRRKPGSSQAFTGWSQGQIGLVPGTNPGTSQDQPDKKAYVYVPFSCLSNCKFWRNPSSAETRWPGKQGGQGLGIPTGRCSLGPESTTTPHPLGCGRDLDGVVVLPQSWGRGRGIPVVLGGKAPPRYVSKQRPEARSISTRPQKRVL